MFPPGSVSPVNVMESDPARLPQRGGVFLTTLPCRKLPAGMMTREFTETGSSKRATIMSSGLLLDALISPRRRILHAVPAGRVSMLATSGAVVEPARFADAGPSRPKASSTIIGAWDFCEPDALTDFVVSTVPD